MGENKDSWHAGQALESAVTTKPFCGGTIGGDAGWG